MKRKAILIALTFTTGHSLQATNLPVEDSTKVIDIEEAIIVSAPKETSKLRTMPTAVSIFSNKQIEERRVESLKELSAYVPNFYMPDYGSSLTSSAYIRGVGSRLNTPAIGLYVDNVAYADKSAYDIQLLDIERIDILRGPQGTLYGRNTMGGLIRVFTRNPFRYQGTDINMGFSGGNNAYNFSATHNNRINNQLAFSLGGFYENQRGFYKNTTRNEWIDNKSAGGGRARVIWMPNSNLKLDFNADYTYTDEGGYAYRYLGVANGESAEHLQQELQDKLNGREGEIIANRPCYYRRGVFNGSLNLSYTAQQYVLSSVTAYQNLKDNMTLDQDFTNLDYFNMSQKQLINSWSEELTFKSHGKRRWNWVNGVYALYQTLDTQSPVALTQDFMQNIFGAANAAMKPMNMGVTFNMLQSPFTASGSFETPTTDLALFHQSTFNDLFGAQGLSLTLGVRLEHERMQLKYNYGGEINYDLKVDYRMPIHLRNLKDESYYNGQLDHNYTQLLPKVALQYAFNPKNNVYISWSKGYRSGGFNIQMFGDLVQGDLRSKMMNTVRNGMSQAFKPYLEMGMPQSMVDRILSYIPNYNHSGTPQHTVYKPEYSYNYEVGGHFSLWDGKIQMDLSAFFMDVYDQQISKFVDSGLGRAMVNAGRGQSCGAEMVLRGGLLDNRLSWNASYGYTHSIFKEYESGLTGEDTQRIDYNGNHVPFVPTHTFAVGADYFIPLSCSWAKGITMGVNTNGAGKIYWTEDNSLQQPFYALLNAHAGIDFGLLKLEVWGKNLTDNSYDTFCFTSNATTHSLKFAQSGRPLQVGINLKLHF